MKSPYARLFIVGSVSIGVLGTTSLLYLALSAFGYLCWSFAAGLPVTGLLKRIRGTLVFLLAIVVVNVFTQSGRVLFELDGVYATQEGLIRGIEQSARLITMLWGGLLVVSTTRLEDFLDAAERWSVRRGRPILAAGTIAICYMPVLVQSARRIEVARRARGEPDLPGFFPGLIRVSQSALPLFASALRNADSLAEAMEARCYDPTAPRSQFRSIPIPAMDFAGITIVFTATVAALSGVV